MRDNFMKTAKFAENIINETVDFVLYGDCLKEYTARDYFDYLTENLCKINSNFQLLQETFVNDGFIKVIDDALQNSKKKNDGHIKSDDVFKDIAEAVSDFVKGEKTKSGSRKRWLDFDDKDDVFYVKDIDSSKTKDTIKNTKETNTKKFTDWFSQKSAQTSYKQLIAKYEKETMFTGSNHYTMQTQINTKFIGDCIAYYLSCLANNPAERYKFINDVKRNPVRL